MREQVYTYSKNCQPEVQTLSSGPPEYLYVNRSVNHGEEEKTGKVLYTSV